MTGSSRARLCGAVVLVFAVAAAVLAADTEPLLTLSATAIGAPASVETLRIELHRWSTDAERAPVLAAAAPPPALPAPAAGAAPAAGRGGRGAARGRGGRGDAPPDPLARLTGAIKAAPTVGFIWTEGVTGYSIKYAWRAAQPDGSERIVLVTDRRLGAHAPEWPGSAPAAAAAPAGRGAIAPSADAEFTVIEMRIDGKGSGEAKSSLASVVIVDANAKTLALDGYAAAPALLTLRRAQGQPEPGRGMKVGR